MSGKLAGRTSLVTGGSRGIGAAIALAFAREGSDIAICHLGDSDEARRIVSDVENLGRKALAVECDVSDEQAVAKMIRSIEKKFPVIDIVVNNAGMSAEKPFIAISVSEWDRMIGVHLRGAYLVTHAFWAGMCERGWGRVINIASQHGLKGTANKAHYCAAKAGLIGFTRGLAYEGAPLGVLVNCIAPGPVDTALLAGLSPEWRAQKMAQLPLGRFGDVDEIAPTAVLLASADGAFYVGQTLSPNGGDIMH